MGENLQDHPTLPLTWFTRGVADLRDAETPATCCAGWPATADR